MSWELRSLTAINRSPLNAVVTTLERPGAHWAVRMPYQNLAESRRARLQSFVSSARGHAQRFYVPVYGWTRRGSFPATELFTNTAFDGTTGWLTQLSTISASDGVLRMVATDNSSSPGARQSPTSLVQYAPYALRSIIHDGQGTAGLTMGRFISDGVSGASDYSTSRGYGVIARVVTSTSPGSQYPIVLAPITGWIPNLTYGELSFASLARCALVDNGPNELLRSDEIDNAAWTKAGTTVTANYYTAPDGTATAERLIEDTSTGEHYALQAVTRANAVGTWCFAVALRRGDVSNLRDRARLRILDSGSTNVISAIFDLTSGTIAVAAAAGGSAANARAFIRSLGGGWYYCCIIGQLPASDTTVRTVVNLIANPSTQSYTGSSSQNIGVWRATLARSDVPVRLTQTTTAGDADGIAQTGGALYLKGLPASTNGLLLKGDPAEIILPSGSQLVRTRTSLNSDAAGLGYFEFEPPLRSSPSDGAAVIVCNPMCRMMMESNVNGWTDRLGEFSDLEFSAVEDVT